MDYGKSHHLNERSRRRKSKLSRERSTGSHSTWQTYQTRQGLQVQLGPSWNMLLYESTIKSSRGIWRCKNLKDRCLNSFEQLNRYNVMSSHLRQTWWTCWANLLHKSKASLPTYLKRSRHLPTRGVGKRSLLYAMAIQLSQFRGSSLQACPRVSSYWNCQLEFNQNLRRLWRNPPTFFPHSRKA